MNLALAIAALALSLVALALFLRLRRYLKAHGEEEAEGHIPYITRQIVLIFGLMAASSVCGLIRLFL